MKTTTIPVLTKSKESQEFFDNLSVGDIFEYSMDSYLYSDVEVVAEKHGVYITYCKPGTSDYKVFGCFICEIIGHKKEKPKELFKFNPEELML